VTRRRPQPRRLLRRDRREVDRVRDRAFEQIGRHLLGDLQREARSLLEAGVPDVWDTLSRKFEGQMIHTALEVTRGRRIEAAQKLGIGRNTITRKIQELGLDD